MLENEIVNLNNDTASKENLEQQVAPAVPEEFLDHDDSTNVDDSNNFEKKVDDEASLDNKELLEGENQDNSDVSLEDKFQKRISKLTAQKKSIEESKNEEIEELKKQLDVLESKMDNNSSVQEQEISLQDVENEIARVESKIASGDFEETSAKGENLNLNIYLNRLSREYSKMVSTNNVRSAEEKYEQKNSTHFKLMEEKKAVEKELQEITGISDFNKLKDHPLAKMTISLAQSDPNKYDISSVGGWSTVFNDALKICAKEGYLNMKSTNENVNLNISNKQQRKSSVISGNKVGLSSKGNANPISNYETNNSDYIKDMIGSRDKKKFR